MKSNIWYFRITGMNGRWLSPSDARDDWSVRRLIGQRNGGPEHIGWIEKPLGVDQPPGVATVGFRSAIPVTPCKQIGVAARKRHRIETLARCPCPLPVSVLPRESPIDRRR